MRSVQRSMCSGMLGLQAVVLFLVGVTLPTVTDVSPGAGIGIGLGLSALCVVAAGLMRSSVGLVLGWAVQALSVALGFVVTAMFALGVIFLALYGGAYVLGARIDRERAERAAAETP
jgi:Protein of unknown function (DUF4233)